MKNQNSAANKMGETGDPSADQLQDIVTEFPKSPLWSRLRGGRYILVFVADEQSRPFVEAWTNAFDSWAFVPIAELEGYLIEHKTTSKNLKLIAASIVNEGAVADEINLIVSRCGMDQRIVHRLFADLLFNFSISKIPFEAPAKVADNFGDLSIEPYAIMSAPRSGSTMLADILTKTGICGMPREHLQQEFVPLLNRSMLDLDRWLGTHMRVNSTPNKVFGTKIISGMFQKLDYSSLLNRYPAIADLTRRTKVIYLRRNDKVRQAVSHYIASQSGTHFAQSEAERQNWERKLQNIAYEPDKIVQNYGWLIVQEIKLERMLRVWGGDVHQVTYEEIVQDRQREVSRIIDFLEVDVPEGFSLPESDIRRMQNSRTQEIFEKFVRDYPNLGYH